MKKIIILLFIIFKTFCDTNLISVYGRGDHGVFYPDKINGNVEKVISLKYHFFDDNSGDFTKKLFYKEIFKFDENNNMIERFGYLGNSLYKSIFKYDENNNMIEEINDYYTRYYKYDENNNIIEE
ncbi:MAG TPA: hypothetical protein PKL98_03040, partial [Candidatus Pacearchaeota archaeon]|nr:hypothetical protein [Candidatus Pacearchaeota archaeon]